MRLQLALVGVLVGSVATSVAYGDGALSMRGVYYKERSTRVVQPMLDGMFDVGTRGLVTGHFLVDAITSASASAGAASPMEPFTEKRYEAGVGYAHELNGPEDSILDVIRLAGDAKYSTESDYQSIYGGVRIDAELAQKNATISAGAGYSHDNVNNKGLQGAMGGPLLLCDNKKPSSLANECNLDTVAVFTSASQLISPNALVGISYDLARQTGFTSNPYRTAQVENGFVPERHPNERLRQAIAASVRYYYPASKTAFIGAYRFYHDDWKINAHTPEVRIIQEVGRTIDASFRYRYYWQDAAFFWEEHYGDPSTLLYVTGDPKMSPYDGHLLEAKLGLLGETFDLTGLWAGARVEGIFEYIVQHNDFHNAVVAHVALTVPFDY